MFGERPESLESLNDDEYESIVSSALSGCCRFVPL